MGIFDRFRRRQREPAEDDAPGLFTARSGAVPPELGGRSRDGGVETEDLWDRPAPVPEPAPEPPSEVEALSALDPEPAGPADHVEHVEHPAVAAAAPEPAWDESTWQDDEAADAGARAEVPAEPPAGLPGDGGSTADQPLFSDYEDAPVPAPPPPSEPVPPLFEPPAVATEPAPTDLVEEPGTPATAGAPAPDTEAEAEGGRTMRVHDGRLDKRPGPIRMTPSEAIALAQDGPQALRRRTHPDA